MYNFGKMSWGKECLEECDVEPKPREVSSNHAVASE